MQDSRVLVLAPSTLRSCRGKGEVGLGYLLYPRLSMMAGRCVSIMGCSGQAMVGSLNTGDMCVLVVNQE